MGAGGQGRGQGQPQSNPNLSQPETYLFGAVGDGGVDFRSPEAIGLKHHCGNKVGALATGPRASSDAPETGPLLTKHVHGQRGRSTPCKDCGAAARAAPFVTRASRCGARACEGPSPAPLTIGPVALRQTDSRLTPHTSEQEPAASAPRRGCVGHMHALSPRSHRPAVCDREPRALRPSQTRPRGVGARPRAGGGLCGQWPRRAADRISTAVSEASALQLKWSICEGTRPTLYPRAPAARRKHPPGLDGRGWQLITEGGVSPVTPQGPRPQRASRGGRQDPLQQTGRRVGGTGLWAAGPGPWAGGRGRGDRAVGGGT